MASRATAAVVPGTHEPGFVAAPILQHHVTKEFGRLIHGSVQLPLSVYSMGDLWIIVAREPEGVHGELRWHLSISHPDRHPTWDEIKTARYRLLPADRACAIILPEPEFYVNVAEQDHVFHLHEIVDDSLLWETM